MSKIKTTAEVVKQITPASPKEITQKKQEHLRDVPDVRNIKEIIQDKVKEKQIQNSDLFKMINLDVQNGYKYLKIDGPNQRPLQRDMALSMFIALEMSLDEIQDALKQSGYPQLYAMHGRDYSIISAIVGGYSFEETNNLLALNNELLLK